MQKAARDAALKQSLPLSAALQGKPDEWVPKMVEYWRVYGPAEEMTATVSEYLEKRAKQRDAAIPLFNEAQAVFRSNKRDEAYKVLEKLRDECPNTYQGFFACKWLAERK